MQYLLFNNVATKHRSPINGGFTLLEMMISITILAFITFLIYQSTVEMYRLRFSLSADSDFHLQIGLATAMLDYDISSLYVPQDVVAAVAPQANLNPNLLVASTFWSAARNNLGIRPSRFIGSENKISFIANNHKRIYGGTAESDFVQITYSFEKDVTATDPKSLVMVKKFNFSAFSDDNFSGSYDVSGSKDKVYVLLRGIKKATFLFHAWTDKTLVEFNDWDSDQSERQYLPPYLIELHLDVSGPDNLNFEGDFKMRPELYIESKKVNE